MGRKLMVVAMAALAAGGCQMTVPFNTAPSREGKTVLTLLEGIATYRERIALPPDAVLIVTIQDVSLADAPASVIARVRLPTNGRQVPLPYAVEYDASRILAGRRYTVSGRVEDGTGRLLWITDTAISLPEPGDRVDLPLVQVRG